MDNILVLALEEANNSSYCASCVYAYIGHDGLTGYCKYNDPDIVQLHPKNIDLFTTCSHWKKK